MLRTGEQYREGIRDGREVWIDGERVKDVTTHPAFKPIVDVKARMYDIQHEPAHKDVFGYSEGKDRNPLLLKLPHTQQDWWDKWNALDVFFKDIKGVVTRVGDETIGEMWSLYDGRDVLNKIDPRFAKNIDSHIAKVLQDDLFHVSANTDPKGDRSKRPQDQDPDMMCHVVKETDAGIIIRGAKYETAAAYADQAFLKPTVGAWSDEKLSDYALGCIVKMGAPGVKHICRSGFAGRGSKEDYPLSNGYDEVDTLMILDNVLIPWEDVFFHRFTEGARYIAPPLFGFPVRAAHPLHGRHDDRRSHVELQADGPRQDAVGKGKARRHGGVSRRHPRAPGGGHRVVRKESRRIGDAQPVAALRRPDPRLRQPAADHAHRARTLRRAAVRDAELLDLRVERHQVVDGQVLLSQRQLGCR